MKMFYTLYQVALVSSGNVEGCPAQLSYAYHTSVPYIIDWIRETTGTCEIEV